MLLLALDLHRLDLMTDGDPVQNARVAGLSRLAQRRIELLDRTVQLERSGRHAEALAIVNTDEGREAMDRACVLISSVIEDEERSLQRRTLAADRAQAQARWAIYGVVADVVGVQLASAGALLRARRLDAEARLERDRRGQDARIAAMLDGVGLGTWQRDLGAGTVVYGQGCHRMLGCGPADMPQGLSAWGEMVHPEDRAGALAAIEPHLDGRTSFFRCEYRVRHKDGRWIWILDSGRVVERDAEGRPWVIAGAFLDITARKEAKEALRASEELTCRVLSTSPDCIKLLSLDARLEFFSEGRLCAMGIDDFDRQLPGADWLSFWAPEDRARVQDALAAALARGTARF